MAPRARSSQSALSVALTLAAVVVFGGLVLVQQGDDPASSPDPSHVAVGSPEASSGDPSLDPSVGPPSPDSSPEPSPAEATPAPPPSLAPATPAPIGGRLWHREPIDELARFDLAQGPWVVGDTFVILGGSARSGYPVSYVLRSEDGLTWEKDPIGIAIDEIAASTFADGRIWLMARVTTGNEPSSWKLLSTADGTAWEWSATVNLPFVDGSDNRGELVRTSSGWLTSLRYVIWESTDGWHWTKADEQLVGSEQAFLHLARLDSATVALGAVWQEDGMLAKAIVRRDGHESWSTREFSMPPNTIMVDIGCRSDGCVAVGSRPSSDFEQPMAWGSTDGLHWSSADLEMPVGIYKSQAGLLVVADAGFLILTVSTGHAWLSTTGSAWRMIRTQPVDLDDTSAFHEYMWSAVAKGDVVLALGGKQDGPEQGKMAAWLGRFSQMLQ